MHDESYLRLVPRAGSESDAVRITASSTPSRLELRAEIENRSASRVEIKSYRLGEFDIEWEGDEDLAPCLLHALTGRATEDGPLAIPLEADVEVPLAGRYPGVPHLEASVIVLGDGLPCVVFGPTTQRVAHAFYAVTWDGSRRITVRGEHTFVGLDARPLAAGELLPDELWLVEVTDGADMNTVLDGYVKALEAENPSSRTSSPLTDQAFFCTWNNHAYWLIDEGEILRTAALLEDGFPDTRWLVIDDGYQKVPAKPQMTRSHGGGYEYDFAIEKHWYLQAPGVSFGFSDGAGVDEQALPNGLHGAADAIRERGIRPGIWLGLEVAWSAPVVRAHPDWFLCVRFHDDPELDRALPDLSIPEVRNEIEGVMRYLFDDCGFEALKLDFISLLTHHPQLRYSNQTRSGAEWRTWLWDMIRSYVPPDGFVLYGCHIPMGASFYHPWVDAYRHSFDMRNGSWANILRNVRWSVVPQMGITQGSPMADADSLSVFDGMKVNEIQAWADYALASGTLLEFSGDLGLLSEEQREFVSFYLDSRENGSKVYYGDFSFLASDGLPTVTFRRCPRSLLPADRSGSTAWLLCLSNWTDDDTSVDPLAWDDRIGVCSEFYDLHEAAWLDMRQLSEITISARSSRLFVAIA